MPADQEHDTLLITCASGRQASNLLLRLDGDGTWKSVRLAVHSPASEDRVKKEYPHYEVVRGELTDPAFVKQIITGATAVFHIGPAFHPHEDVIGFNMIDSAVEEAKGGKLKHFVYSSVLNSQLRKMMNHDVKRYVCP